MPTRPWWYRSLREDAGGDLLRPWDWSLFPDVPGGTSDHATVIAPPPSIASAGEVAKVAARVLTGDLRAWA
jgi:hypothetical protein